MQENISRLVENKLELDESSVWVLDKSRKFHYSDGIESERYLRKVISQASDLSSDSYELEGFIKDWNSEYHLSRKRAQLLKGFKYGKSMKVLEVGCGCGAITRFLGETFDKVTAIEGSIARAGIARMRTRDLNNVSIICAPFQEIVFKEKFDIIFCIGVFEYSNMFVKNDDPYNFIVKYFSEILNPDGELVIAIENQFGLKYFSSSTEDHTAIRFDGIEGYPRYRNKNARTFGYYELHNMLKGEFDEVRYYFPYPDYKMPSCILSHRFLEIAKAGELIGGFNNQTNYLESPTALFSEKLALLELDRNGLIPVFSNSFLIFAGKRAIRSHMNELGLLYSQNRVEKFQTITRLIEKGDGGITVEKFPSNGQENVRSGHLILRKSMSDWVDAPSVHVQVMKRAKDKSLDIKAIFEPCVAWINCLKKLSEHKNGVYMLDGIYLDCTWMNSFITEGNCTFTDMEWEWNDKISLNRLVVKSVFEFLNDISHMSDLNPLLDVNSKASLIKSVARTLGIEITESDFSEFIEIESKIYETIYGGKNAAVWKYYMNLELKNRALAKFILAGTSFLKKVKGKLNKMVSNNHNL